MDQGGQNYHGNPQRPNHDQPERSEIEGETPTEAFDPGEFKHYQPAATGEKEPRQFPL
jgi:hypothetical protein